MTDKLQRPKRGKPAESPACRGDDEFILIPRSAIASELECSELVAEAFAAFLPESPAPPLTAEEEREAEAFKAYSARFKSPRDLTRPKCTDAVLSIMQPGLEPGSNLSWGKFHSMVLDCPDTCRFGGKDPARGYDLKSVKRAVAWIKNNPPDMPLASSIAQKACRRDK